MEPVQKKKDLPELLTGLIDTDFKILSELDDKSLLNICRLSTENSYIRQLCSTKRHDFWKKRLESRFGPKVLQYVSSPEQEDAYAKFYLSYIYYIHKYEYIHDAFRAAIRKGNIDMIRLFDALENRDISNVRRNIFPELKK